MYIVYTDYLLVIFNRVDGIYFLVYKKNIRFDFDDELKIGDVGYKHLT